MQFANGFPDGSGPGLKGLPPLGRCNRASSPGRLTRTNQHCPENYARHRESATPFCVVRRPLDRAVSTYNMRRRRRRDQAMNACDPTAMERWIIRMVSRRGDVDNHEARFGASLPPGTPCPSARCRRRSLRTTRLRTVPTPLSLRRWRRWRSTATVRSRSASRCVDIVDIVM